MEEHLFYSPVALMGDSIGDADRTRLTAAYRTMVGQRIIPLFTDLTAYVRDEYLPLTRETSGIDAIPNGADYYVHLIKRYTTTDLTADEIHELGLSEVARLRGEMERVIGQHRLRGRV